MRNTVSALITTTLVAAIGVMAIDAASRDALAKFGRKNIGNVAPTAPQGAKVPKTPSRRKFRMKLTLREPGDLKVREGDTIKAGQVIADRVAERLRLEGEKGKIEAQIKHLDHPILKPIPIKSVAPLRDLPEANYLTQVAAIDIQRLHEAKAEDERVGQIRKLEALKGLPELPPEVFDHEAEKTKEFDRGHDLASAELRKSEAELEAAKYHRETEEHAHALEVSRYEIAIQQNELERSSQLQKQEDAERDKAFKIAQLRQQIIDIDNKIEALANIKSPYDGKIQRIKFTEQSNQDLIVELVLAINASDRQFPGRANPGTAPAQGDQQEPFTTPTAAPGDAPTTSDGTDAASDAEAWKQ